MDGDDGLWKNGGGGHSPLQRLIRFELNLRCIDLIRYIDLRYIANPAKNKTSVNIIKQINATVTKT